jgi:exocyst complex component 2
MDIQTSDDPVWTYFDSQHTYIIKQMNTSYKTAVASIRGLRPYCLCP